jgi:hypothetical protein
MPRTAAAKPKRQPKAVQYAKYAEVGDWVHAKGIHVTSEANLARWYGNKGSSKYFSGIVQEKFLNEIVGRREWWITAQYDLPGGESATKSNKAIFHYPGKWKDPDPPPTSGGPRYHHEIRTTEGVIE